MTLDTDIFFGNMLKIVEYNVLKPIITTMDDEMTEAV